MAAKYTDEIDKYIRKNVKGISAKELTEKVNSTFLTNYTVRQIEIFKKTRKLHNDLDSRFRKGNVPHNAGQKGVCAKGCEKGWFKKGGTPPRAKEIGSERISKDGYIEVKIDKNEWKFKHRIEWEKHNGAIPKSYVVIFLDRNKLNCDINNLALVTRSELKVMNQHKLFYDNVETTKAGIMIAKAIDSNNKLKKGKTINDGLCKTCKKEKAEEGFTRCNECREKNKAYMRAYYARKKGL